jgi:conjugal transfer pilus assembly protein TraA
MKEGFRAARTPVSPGSFCRTYHRKYRSGALPLSFSKSRFFCSLNPEGAAASVPSIQPFFTHLSGDRLMSMIAKIKSSKAGSTALALGICTVLAAGTAVAGSSDTEFEMLYDRLSNWSQGYLGKSISLMFLLVGLGVGVIRNSILGAIVCVAAAMALFIGPMIIDQIVTGVI